jgi:CubicO group peptidase (beta-lactamase class C family)
MRFALAVCLLVGAPAGACETIRALVAAEFAKDGVGGLSLGILEHGELVDTAAFGYADVESKVRATPEHVYRTGSITKQFTALALLKMTHDGTVGLSDRVNKYVPEIDRVRERYRDAPPITLVQLATMTSGLAREPEGLSRFLVGPASDWLDITLSALPSVRYDFPPDTRYQYSNIGYAILGAALERASARSYMDYVRSEILEPLDMRDTDFVPRAHFESRLATGYHVEGDVIDSERSAWEHLGRGYKVPNGALYSTVADLARFISFQLGHGPASVLPITLIEDNLVRLNSSTGDLSEGYGIGFRVIRRGELVVYGHTGSVSGYRAAAFFDRANDTGVVILRNVTGGTLDVAELAITILESLAP